jgi:hypothetical protein
MVEEAAARAILPEESILIRHDFQGMPEIEDIDFGRQRVVPPNLFRRGCASR